MEIIHLTDPHFGCEDKAALVATERFIAERKPDAVIVSGDISRDGLQRELDAACAWMAKLPAPVLVTPGNHDVPYYNLFGRLIDPMRRFRRAARDLRTKVWQTSDWIVVPIITARGVQLRLNWAQGAISRRQVDEAVEILRAAPPEALRIVVTHHPLDWPNDAPIHGQTINGLAALERLVDAGAELFLSGHLHFASARMVGKRALSITSGTLSLRVRHEPTAFTAIRRPSPDELEVEVVHVKQGVAETATVRKFALEPSGRLHPKPTPAGTAAPAGPLP